MGSPIAGYGGALLLTSTPSIVFTNNVLANPLLDNATFVESTPARRYWDVTQPVTVQTELDEVQKVAISGNPTGGTFTLTFGADTTAAIAYNATAAQVQTALQALADIGSGNVTCTGGPLPNNPVTVEFTGTLGYANQMTMTFTNSLTGGITPTPVVTVLQNGQAWTTVASGFTIQDVGGVVLFAPALYGAAPGVRASGYYLPWVTLANITQWTFDGQTTFQDDTSCLGDGQGGLLPGAGWKTFAPLLLEGTFTATQFWVPESQTGFAADITARSQFVIAGVAMTGNRYEGYAYAKKESIKTDVAKLTENSLDFQLNGQFYIV